MASDFQEDSKVEQRVVDLLVPEEKSDLRNIGRMSEIFDLTVDELDEKRIIHQGMRDKRLLSRFRDIRTKIVEQTAGKAGSIMVTSVGEGGGCSFVSTNLAACIALDHGKTSLLVSANIYSPEQTQFEVGEDVPGFTDFLDDPRVSAEDVIFATGVPRLRYVPVGSIRSGHEYYSSYRLSQFIEEVCERYEDRYVIVDAPSIGSTADPRVIADLCDSVLLVIPYGQVTSDQIKAAIDSFPKEKVLGAVFNHT